MQVPRIFVSARTGEGVPALRAELAQRVAAGDASAMTPANARIARRRPPDWAQCGCH